MTDKEVILVTGGCRSGKSSYALQLLADAPAKVYVATAPVTDDEMKDRVRRHREERGSAWRTVEEPIEVPTVLDREAASGEPVVIDCLTTWVSNLTLQDGGNAETRALEYLDRLLESVEGYPARIVLITNEVGSGVVPPYPLGRLFRDLAGIVNQRVGKAADRIVLMVCGCPVFVKGKVEPGL